jgi:hypothetical protein
LARSAAFVRIHGCVQSSSFAHPPLKLARSPILVASRNANGDMPPADAGDSIAVCQFDARQPDARAHGIGTAAADFFSPT